MSIIDRNVQTASSEAAFDSLANLSIKPLLRFIATECITSMRPSPDGSRSNFAIVDFVVQLLVANKDRLEQDCRCPILPAEAGCYLPRVPSSLRAATRLDETGDSAAQNPDDTQITTAQVDALKAQPRDLEAASFACSAAPAASHHAEGMQGANMPVDVTDAASAKLLGLEHQPLVNMLQRLPVASMLAAAALQTAASVSASDDSLRTFAQQKAQR